MMCFRPDKRYVPFLSFSEMVYGPDQVLRQGYMTLLQSTGWLFQNSSMDISLSNFKDGHALFGFDITPDESSGNNFQLLEEGRLALEIKLSRALQNSVPIIAYVEYDGLIQLDKEKNVYSE